MTFQQRLNWQISELRGWKKTDAGYGCTHLVDPNGNIVETSRHPERIEAREVDWHADANWPTLFREFPKGTRLFQPEYEGTTVEWALCGCQSTGLIRVCQPGKSPAEVVCKAWIAYTLRAGIIENLPVELVNLARATPPGSDTIH